MAPHHRLIHSCTPMGNHRPPQRVHRAVCTRSRTHIQVLFRQLLALLGAPRLPPNVTKSPTETAILTDWQLDALMRRRTLEGAERAQDTLRSIIKLVDKIQNMPVDKDIRNDVVNALNELDEVKFYHSSSISQAI